MATNDFIILIEKYLKNTISEEECNTLETLLKNDQNAQIFKERIKNDYVLKNQNREFDAQQALKKALEKINTPQKSNIIHLRPFYRYAAAVLLLIGLGFFFTSVLINDTDSILSNKTADKQIQLQFEDGTQRLLTEQDVDSIRGNGNTIIGHVNQGTLSYGKDAVKKLVYNTLNVPYGKRFQITLSDGTRVHLNAGSSLRYPVSFLDGSKREVFLEGEAFFEVAKDSAHKFVVNANDLDIEVLGTEFNVSAYIDDVDIKTTLREGSVKVLNASEAILLKPDEQASLNKKSERLKKKSVDVSQYTSWMQGKLVFRSTYFEEIIKKLERHYDVNIVNTNPELSKEQFTARFEEEDVEQVMLYFSKSYGFEYTIEEKTITIR